MSYLEMEFSKCQFPVFPPTIDLWVTSTVLGKHTSYYFHISQFIMIDSVAKHLICPGRHSLCAGEEGAHYWPQSKQTMVLWCEAISGIYPIASTYFSKNAPDYIVTKVTSVTTSVTGAQAGRSPTPLILPWSPRQKKRNKLNPVGEKPCIFRAYMCRYIKIVSVTYFIIL